MNKAAIAISSARSRLGMLAAFASIDSYSGHAGKIAKVDGMTYAVNKDGVFKSVGGQAGSAAPSLLTWDQANQFATSIDDLNVGANHVMVKTLPIWQKMYLSAPREVSYINADGNPSKRMEDTMPCHNYGVVLQSQFLQVDHYMPQAGGEHFHILKTMRAMGMTSLSAFGAKGAAFFSGNLRTLTINPKGRDRTYDHLTTASAAGRWTTSEQGDAFLSLLACVSVSSLDDVARMCKNSILNLVPLCPECNHTKSDFTRPIR